MVDEAGNPVKSSAIVNWIKGLLSLSWVVLVVVLYYVAHKPFNPALAAAWVFAVVHLLIPAAVLLTAGGLGERLLPLSRLSMENIDASSHAGALLRVSLQASLGLGLLSLVVLLVGSVAGLLSWGAWLILAAGMILLRRDIRTWWMSLRAGWNSLYPSSGFQWGAAVLIALLLVFSLLSSLAPPGKFDALVYHLALPRTYVDTGHVSYQPENMFWGMPEIGEMLYTWTMALAGVEAAAVLGWCFGVLALLGLWGFSAANWGHTAGWAAATAVLSGFTLASSLSWAYVDWLTALFGLAVLVFLNEWRGKHESKWLMWAGIFSGFAIGVKFSSGAILLAGVVVIVWDAIRSSHTTRRIPHLLADLLRYGIPAVLLFLPWLFRNLVATGNPFYPLLIPSGAMDAFRLHLYQGLPPYGDALEAVLLPWRATIFGVEGGAGYNASIGPLLLALAPLAVIIPLRKEERDKPYRFSGRAVGTAAIIGLVGLTVWAIASRVSGYLIQSRLYFVLFPSLAVLAGTGFSQLNDLRLPQVRLGRVVGALLILVLGLNTLQVALDVFGSGALQNVLGLESDQKYLEQNLGWYVPAMQAVVDSGKGSKTVMLWETRGLYCVPVCDSDEVIDRWWHDLTIAGSPSAVLSQWRAEGYTHLLLHRAGVEFVQREDLRYPAEVWDALDGLLKSLPLPVDFGGAYELYTLVPES